VANIKEPANRRSKNVTFRLTEAQLEILDSEAEKRQCNRTDVMRSLIEESDFAKAHTE